MLHFSASRLPLPVWALVSLFLTGALSSTDEYSDELLRRALPAAPDGYTPTKMPCPVPPPSIRKPLDLSPEEAAWLKKRRVKAISPMKEFLNRVGIKGFDVNGYFDRHSSDYNQLPNVGIAVSGGGYRAMLNGAGALAAFDSRTTGSTEPGHLGGLLQSATYVSGLSGGGWLVGSLFVNNFTSVQALMLDSHSETSRVWKLDRSIAKGPKKHGIAEVTSSLDYWKHIRRKVERKKQAGFNASVTDYWGLGLSQQLINATDGGPSYTFSSIADQPGFPEGDQPMPIIVATLRAPGEAIVPKNATVFEFTPFEMGSHDPTLFGMLPLKYVGSQFEAGRVTGNCVNGFDNAGFIMGTSSSLWNAVILKIMDTEIPGALAVLNNVVHKAANKVFQSENDIALWTPNPFYKWNGGDHTLTLADGGEDKQNIPLHPLIQPIRHVDVLFAVDSSSNGDRNWPDGSALVATHSRTANATLANGTAFPAVPDTKTFINLGLNARPVMFGCDNVGPPPAGAAGSARPPLVVYLPNSPYTFFSNLSTFTRDVKDDVRNEMVRNGYAVVTQGNGTFDHDWPACVGCAVLSRSLARNGEKVPELCADCFRKYCWDGKTDSRDVDYNPLMRMPGNKKRNAAAGGGRVAWTGLLGAALLSILWLL